MFIVTDIPCSLFNGVCVIVFIFSIFVPEVQLIHFPFYMFFWLLIKMNIVMKNYLKVGCWNVHNIKSSVLNKAEDQQFIKEVQSYDIFCMQETKMMTYFS